MAKRNKPDVLGLTPADKKYIEERHDYETPHEISDGLGVPVDSVIKYIDQYLEGGATTLLDASKYAECPELRELPEWELLKQKYLPDELILFEQTYIQYKDQFKDDILATERRQVFLAIDLEIRIHRNQVLAKRSQFDIDRLQKCIEREYDRDAEERDQTKIDSYEAMLQASKAGLTSSSKEYKDLVAEHRYIYEKLKGTREQRIKDLSNQKIDILAKIKEFESEDNRLKQVALMELRRKAMEREKQRLQSLHTFKDQKVDLPLKNFESVKNLNEN